MTKLSNKGNLEETNNNSVDEQSVLKFLSNSERSVLEKLIERKEGVYQSEISRMEHMTKVNYYRLKAVALGSGCKPAKDRQLCKNRHLEALYLGVRCIA